MKSNIYNELRDRRIARRQDRFVAYFFMAGALWLGYLAALCYVAS